jgi:anhydro-N-acetylmuramic acid kinase
MRVAGIMSGTSLDGIDVAIVDIGGRGAFACPAYGTQPYPEGTRRRILEAQTAQAISRLSFELGELYAKAVKTVCRRSKVPQESLELAGCHGQTIYHEGTNTLQIGEADVIAERLGIPVVSDFRTRDIAAGGQGAPLVPFVDNLLFRSPTVNRVALNIGGIANITVLDKGPVIAFDTGPGNMVIDQLTQKLLNKPCDVNGATAAKGRVQKALLDELLQNPYYQAKPPKTAGREQYGADFVNSLLKTGALPEDLIATATALTAATIAKGIGLFAPGTTEVIAAGGGVHNRQLMAQLAAFLPAARIATSAEFGIDPDAKEAIAFAILAWRTWRRKPGNLPSATGARHPVILGKLSF